MSVPRNDCSDCPAFALEGDGQAGRCRRYARAKPRKPATAISRPALYSEASDMPKAMVDWSAHDAVLRKMVKAGATGSTIAAAIPNATRSGVIARLHRIGLPLGRPKPRMAAPKPAVFKRLAPAAPRPLVPAAPERRQPFRPKAPIKPTSGDVPRRETAFRAPADAVAMLALPALGACRWPYDDADGVARLACGAATGSEDPTCVYCAGHRALAYQPRVTKTPQGRTSAAQRAEAPH